MVDEMEIEVRSTELDALGHVNNAKYLEYLEWGRFEWVKAAGVPIDSFGRGGVGTVIVNVNINYRREATMGQRLTVRTWLASMGRSSFRIAQEVVDAEGRTVCDAVVTSAMFDTRTRASMPIPDDLRAKFGALVRATDGDAADRTPAGG
ncbi:MAG TPA: thioesterase family protein [Longimicrobiaceae bacterium]|jgi:thioesterase-3|nr:thioesterase family protein [Longimicrobiaceae bacterium]